MQGEFPINPTICDAKSNGCAARQQKAVRRLARRCFGDLPRIDRKWFSYEEYEYGKIL